MRSLSFMAALVLTTVIASAAEDAAIAAFSRGVDDYMKVRNSSKGKAQ